MVPMPLLLLNRLLPPRLKLLFHPLPSLVETTRCQNPRTTTLIMKVVSPSLTKKCSRSTSNTSPTIESPSNPNSPNNLSNLSMPNRSSLLMSYSSNKHPIPSNNHPNTYNISSNSFTNSSNNNSSNPRMPLLNLRMPSNHSIDKVETISMDLKPKNLLLSNRSPSNLSLALVPTTIPSVDSVSNLSCTARASINTNSITSNSPPRTMSTQVLDNHTTRTPLVVTLVLRRIRSQPHPHLRLPPLFSSPSKVSISRTSTTRNKLEEVWDTTRTLHTTPTTSVSSLHISCPEISSSQMATPPSQDSRDTTPWLETYTTSLHHLLKLRQSLRQSQRRLSRLTVELPTPSLTLLLATMTNLPSDPPVSVVDSVIRKCPLNPTRAHTATTSSVSDNRMPLVSKLLLPTKGSSLLLPRVVLV